jgi:signal peptidase I
MDEPRRSPLPPERPKATHWLRVVGRQFWLWLVIVFLVAITYGFINRFVITSVIVQGRSMVPTLQDGERYLLDRWSYYYRLPERGDVVVLRDPGHQDLAIKRIVGMPGDTIQLRDGVVMVNGKRFIEPYLSRGTLTYMPDFKDRSVLLGADQYFVLGDNRPLSEDSRYYGPIQRDRIVGCLSQ